MLFLFILIIILVALIIVFPRRAAILGALKNDDVQIFKIKLDEDHVRLHLGVLSMKDVKSYEVLLFVLDCLEYKSSYSY